MRIIHNRRHTGLATVTALALLTLLTAVIAMMMRLNLDDRHYNSHLEDRFRARALAEKGIYEALNKPATPGTETSFTETGEDWSLTVTTELEGTSPQTYARASHAEARVTRGITPVKVEIKARFIFSQVGAQLIEWTEE